MKQNDKKVYSMKEGEVDVDDLGSEQAQKSGYMHLQSKSNNIQHLEHKRR